MSRPLRYVVQLSAEQEQTLKAMVSKGSSKARVMTRARILLMTHRQMSDSDISETLGISVQMVLECPPKTGRSEVEVQARRQP